MVHQKHTLDNSPFVCTVRLFATVSAHNPRNQNPVSALPKLCAFIFVSEAVKIFCSHFHLLPPACRRSYNGIALRAGSPPRRWSGEGMNTVTSAKPSSSLKRNFRFRYGKCKCPMRENCRRTSQHSNLHPCIHSRVF